MENCIRNFSDAEIAGRKLYEENELILNGGIYKYEFTKYIYEKYDVYYPTLDRADEIKNRDIYTGNYIYSGYMLEKNKFDELRKHREGYYVNFFKDSIIIWDIAHMPYPEFKERWCTETTANGTYGQKKVLKTVTDLTYEMALLVAYNGKVLNKEQRARAKGWFYKQYKNNKQKDVA